jgi:hypothetical protein
MNQRRWIALLAVAALAALWAPALSHAQDWKVIDDDEWCDGKPSYKCEVREVTLPAWDDVRVRAVNGGIKVAVWDRDEIRVRARVKVKGSKSSARETLDRIEIQADEDEIRATGPKRKSKLFGLFGGSRDWSVSYRLMVPRDANVDLKTVNGGIAVTGVGGQVEFSSVNGGVVVSDVGNDVVGGTTNGGVKISLVPSGWNGHEIDVHTTNGGIKIALPREFSARVDVATTNGGIDVDHPVTIERHSRNRLRGTIGDGGDCVVRARTTNGGVSLRRADT